MPWYKYERSVLTAGDYMICLLSFLAAIAVTYILLNS